MASFFALHTGFFTIAGLGAITGFGNAKGTEATTTAADRFLLYPIADGHSTDDNNKKDKGENKGYIVYRNFCTIMSFNPSFKYALSIGLLSDELK